MKLFKLLKKNITLIVFVFVIIAVIYVVSNTKDGFQSYVTDGLTEDDIVNAGFDNPTYTYQCPANSPYSMLITNQYGVEADVNYANISRCIKPCASYSECANGACVSEDLAEGYCILKTDYDAFNNCEGDCTFNNIESIGYRFEDDYIIPDAYTLEGFKVDSFANKTKHKVAGQKKCVCPPHYKTNGKKCYRPIKGPTEIAVKIKNKLDSITKYKKSQRVKDPKTKKLVTKLVTHNIPAHACK